MDLLGQLVHLLSEVRIRLEELAEREEQRLAFLGLDVMVPGQGDSTRLSAMNG